MRGVDSCEEVEGVMHDLRMPDVNSVLIAGNLTRDPAFRKTTNGTPVTNFWIASNRRFRDNAGQWRENVCYVGVVAWYKLAENCANNLKKGSAVVIEGELQSRSLKTDDGRNRNIVEIKARRVQFLDRKETSSDNAGDAHTGYENGGAQVFDAVEEEENPVHTSHGSAGRLKGRFDYGVQDLEL